MVHSFLFIIPRKRAIISYRGLYTGLSQTRCTWWIFLGASLWNASPRGRTRFCQLRGRPRFLPVLIT